MKKLIICKRCVMDNLSDNTIYFDNDGICNYCNTAYKEKDIVYFPNESGKIKLSNLIKRIKDENKNKNYDCIMGISGGLDSAYLAYLGSTKWNLRILAVHVDDGFDTDQTKINISRLCDKANIKIIVIKPNEKQFCELTRAYIMAGVPNIAVPQDNILFGELYKYARENDINVFLSGGNFALESILQKGNTYGAYDTRNIRNINNKFGRTKLNKLPLISEFKRDIDSKIRKIKTYRPLNYINYDRNLAFEELHNFCGYEYYGSKHLENKLTKFAQLYWFPEKFNVDKRKSHLSSMIVSGQISREEALLELVKPISSSIKDDDDFKYVLNKLDLTENMLSEIIKEKNKMHEDFKTSRYEKLKFVTNKIRIKLNLIKNREV